MSDPSSDLPFREPMHGSNPSERDDHPPLEMTVEVFEEHVAAALDQIPDELAELIQNCVIMVVDEPPADLPGTLGLYTGTPLTEREANFTGLPDMIEIFRLPTLAICRTEDEVIEEIGITVVHEIAHHFGIDDDRLHDLGYA